MIMVTHSLSEWPVTDCMTESLVIERHSLTDTHILVIFMILDLNGLPADWVKGHFAP
jgi:hypothetical protein